ncbi:TMEM175 family protein [Agromyces salentinus]|uniref:TMEM175 family protein n=1 Tax=Agromyces salentinus TaxID=269421 RepID=A0ABN2MZ85_9MICO|nr:TMEM175 family protein [Agromyces salentinus]
MARTERGLDRLVNFSDATVAIAITILILPLVDLAGDIGDQHFGEFFAANVGSFVAFVVTFAVIGRFWVIHHRVFELVRDYSPGLVWANMLWLASIVFLPFAANAVSTRESVDGSFDAAYIGTMIVTTTAMLIIDLTLRREPALLVDGAVGAIDPSRSISVLVALLVAGLLAFLVPAIGMLWVLLLFAAPLVARALRALVPSIHRA